jgi:pyruvate,water dikinase
VIRRDTPVVDRYLLDKHTLTFREKHIAEQLTAVKALGKQFAPIAVPKKEQQKQKISDQQILTLARFGKKLEKHFYFPQEISWALAQDAVYILNTRQITPLYRQESENSSPLPVKGEPGSPGIVTGQVKLIEKEKDFAMLKRGDIIVTAQADVALPNNRQTASAVITEKGNPTSAAILAAKKLGIPAVFGIKSITKLLRPGSIITINGSTGEISSGGIHQTASHTTTTQPVRTATKLLITVSDHNSPEKLAALPSDGIGVLGANTLMQELGQHPKKVLRDGKQKQYTDEFAKLIASYCTPFYPRPVYFNTSSATSKEFRTLDGGKSFEPSEENPLLGYRGAFRSLHDPHVFSMELEAISQARNMLGAANLQLIIPFIRSVSELTKVKKVITSHGLYRSASFKLWLSADVPATVILLEDYIRTGIDGVVIDHDSLTSLLLGTDQNNSEVAATFHEQHAAVLQAIRHCIKTCQKHELPTIITGQAASLYPAFIENVVDWGVTNIAVMPNALDNIRKTIYKYERRLIT